MKPTMNLRFVGRDIMVPHPQVKNISYVKTVRILQQWWASDPDCYEDFVLKTNGEWREVPLVKEE